MGTPGDALSSVKDRSPGITPMWATIHRIAAATVLCALCTGTGTAAIGDSVRTERKVLSEILISAGPIGSQYYVRTQGGWGVPACNGVLHAYIDATTPGAEAVLSAMLTARSGNIPIGFDGICGDANGNPQYLQIRSAFL